MIFAIAIGHLSRELYCCQYLQQRYDILQQINYNNGAYYLSYQSYSTGTTVQGFPVLVCLKTFVHDLKQNLQLDCVIDFVENPSVQCYVITLTNISVVTRGVATGVYRYIYPQNQSEL